MTDIPKKIYRNIMTNIMTRKNMKLTNNLKLCEINLSIILKFVLKNYENHAKNCKLIDKQKNLFFLYVFNMNMDFVIPSDPNQNL